MRPVFILLLRLVTMIDLPPHPRPQFFSVEARAVCAVFWVSLNYRQLDLSLKTQAFCRPV